MNYTALGLASSTALPPPATTTLTIQTSPVTTQTSSIPTESGEALSLYIGVGASGVVVILIAAALVVISVTVCLKKRKSKHINTLTDNVAYGVSEKEMELSTNAAYNTTFDNLHDKGYVYDYIDTTDISITTAPNEAYATSDVTLSSNPAYGVQH